MAYSYPYVILLILLGACAFLFEYTTEKEKRDYITASALMLFFLFFGFRGYVYTDWIGYTELFRNVEWGDVFKFDLTQERTREPGFIILCMVCKTLINSYVFLNVTCVSIYLFLLVRCCKFFEIENIAFVLVLLVAMDGTGMVLNLLRNTISIGIWMNSLVYIRDRKPLKYFALCLLASSFHLSSLIFFPMYFFLHLRTNRWIFLGLVTFFFIFYISKSSIVVTVVEMLGLEGALGVKLQAYTERFTSARALNPTGTLEKLGLVTLLFLYYDEIMERYKDRNLLINCLILYFGMYYFLGEFKTMSERMALLFVFAHWLVWIDVICVLAIENNKKLLTGGLFLYCAYMTTLNLNQPIMEYDNVLLGAKSEAQRRQMFFKIVGDDE